MFSVLALVTPARALASESPFAVQRQKFLAAEQAIARNQDAAFFAISGELTSYPLYPYLQYQWLKNHLDADSEIKRFLLDYQASRFAAPLRQKWLLQLAKQQAWQALLDQYQGGGDAELQCYVGLARFETGQTLEAFNLARSLWLSGKTQPDNCEPLFSLFKASPYFSPTLLQERFLAALNRDNQALASVLAQTMAGTEREVANLWLKLHRQPALVSQEDGWRQYQEQAGPLFSHAIGRWLDKDVEAALQAWENEKAKLTIPATVSAEIEKRLAIALALKRDKRAYTRLTQLQNTDESAREWRVRAALNAQNWQDVITAIDHLTDEEKVRERWQYWRARALAATGQSFEADTIFQQLAKNRSFYGFLAADRLRQGIALADRPLAVPEQDLEILRSRSEFQAVSEWLSIDRKQEAKREWWFAVGRLDNRLLPAAAKLAQQWHIPDLAISTIAKANYWDDVELRFPLAYAGQIQQQAVSQQLDPTLVFGLVRQESAFDEQADSPAGAKGLMQLMPKTGRQIANDLREPWDGDHTLFKPDINIKYGAFYFKRLLHQFDGHVALATAAYNAGANNVKRWLPDGKPMPADIWIETIPFKETRGYVASVLMYSLIYQQRLQRDGLKLGELLREVMPG